MIGITAPSDRGIDALLPAEIALKAETVGVQKTRLDLTATSSPSPLVPVRPWTAVRQLRYGH